MTHMDKTPGYQGYLRSFQREYISGGPRSSTGNKYTDIEPERHGLLAEDYRQRSLSSVSYDAARILAHQQQLQRAAAKEAQRQARLLANHGAASERAFSSSQQLQKQWGEKTQLNGGVLSAAPPASGRLARPASSHPSSAPRNVGLWGTTYSDSLGAGRRPWSSPINPRFPHAPVQFSPSPSNSSPENSPSPPPPAEGQSLNARSLAQAIAELPAAENLLKNDPWVAGSYTRDYGARGSHPLQRNVADPGLLSGPGTAAGHPGSALTASPGYSVSWVAPKSGAAAHAFPSSHLIGPSGGWVGKHPLEGGNFYAQTSGYDLPQQPRVPVNPFLASPSEILPPSSSLVTGEGISDLATTSELFLGSSKRSAGTRPPGYAGFVPSSTHTRLFDRLRPTDRDSAEANREAHLLRTYSADMPGYSGHHPRSVNNVRGARSPRGKRRMEEGLAATLILDSMKV